MEIIKEFEKIWKPPYEKKMPKHEPTPRYFHPLRQLAKCMMISNEINRHDQGSYMGKTAPSSDVNVTEEEISKEIIVHENVSELTEA